MDVFGERFNRMVDRIEKKNDYESALDYPLSADMTLSEHCKILKNKRCSLTTETLSGVTGVSRHHSVQHLDSVHSLKHCLQDKKPSIFDKEHGESLFDEVRFESKKKKKKNNKFEKRMINFNLNNPQMGLKRDVSSSKSCHILPGMFMYKRSVTTGLIPQNSQTAPTSTMSFLKRHSELHRATDRYHRTVLLPFSGDGVPFLRRNSVLYDRSGPNQSKSRYVM